MRIIIDRISVSRGEDLVLRDLSVQAESGRALIVRGPNGAGKSTFLRAMAGLLPLEAGHIELQEAEADFAGVPLPELCHYLGHENAMKSGFTVGENLVFWQSTAGHPHLAADEALAMVGLERLESVPYGHLSTGQRRRAAIARLLVSYRPVWLLDEPTAGLDSASEAQCAALMRAHLEDGGLVIAATHVPLDLPNARMLDMVEMAV